MFTELDKVLYPKKCEVIQTASHEFIYPIFKNGSTSLFTSATNNNWKILINNQINKCDKIIIFLRNPLERFFSGVNTYIEHCLSQGLDEKTVKHFVDNYLFLNRHYMPQTFWLIHLLRYTNKNTIVSIKDTKDISKFTTLYKNKSDNLVKKNIEVTDKLYFYIKSDDYFFNYVNQDINFFNLIQNYKKDCSTAYEYIFNYSESLINALPKN